jgi:general secretion pathway protein G
MEKRNGFTLVELLVVVGIISILSGLVIVALNPAQYFRQGRDGRRLSDLGAISAAVEQYFAQNNAYPVPSGGAIPTDAGGQLVDGGGVVYLKSVPTEPDDGADYSYAVSGLNFEICAGMESTPLPSDCRNPAYGGSGNCCLTNPF